VPERIGPEKVEKDMIFLDGAYRREERLPGQSIGRS
jgi:hypothetical protein